MKTEQYRESVEICSSEEQETGAEERHRNSVTSRRASVSSVLSGDNHFS